eukprot:1123675-Pelagomonas_calceolata.AAC.1
MPTLNPATTTQHRQYQPQPPSTTHFRHEVTGRRLPMLPGHPVSSPGQLLQQVLPVRAQHV